MGFLQKVYHEGLRDANAAGGGPVVPALAVDEDSGASAYHCGIQVEAEVHGVVVLVVIRKVLTVIGQRLFAFHPEIVGFVPLAGHIRPGRYFPVFQLCAGILFPAETVEHGIGADGCGGVSFMAAGRKAVLSKTAVGFHIAVRRPGAVFSFIPEGEGMADGAVTKCVTISPQPLFLLENFGL